LVIEGVASSPGHRGSMDHGMLREKQVPCRSMLPGKAEGTAQDLLLTIPPFSEGIHPGPFP
jgi:hypothetical protein